MDQIARLWSHLSIRYKVGIPLVVLVAILVFEIFSARDESAAVVQLSDRQVQALDTRDTLASIDRKFAELSYWLTDLANSLSEESEANAAVAAEELKSLLARQTILPSSDVKALTDIAASVQEQAQNAVLEYALEERDNGDQLMQDVRAKLAEGRAILAPGIETAESLARTSIEEVVKQAAATDRALIFLIISAIVLAAVILAMVEFLIVRPIVQADGTIQSLAEGNIDLDIPFAERGDEIGSVGRSLDVFKAAAIENRRLEAEAEAARKEAAERDADAREKEAALQRQQLEQEQERSRKTEERQRNLQDLIAGFDAAAKPIIDQFREASESLGMCSRMMSQTAQGTTKKTTQVSQSSSEASKSVESAAQAVHSLSDAMQDMYGQVGEGQAITEKAVAETRAGEEHVKTLAQVTSDISDIVKLINDISDQTNLLALNATIEAARAGDAGKGFAVVASEVKSLANQTVKATEDIEERIANMLGATSKTEQSMQEISQAILLVSQMTEALQGQIAEQTDRAGLIAADIGNVSSMTSTISEQMTLVDNDARETERHSDDVNQSSAAIRGNLEGLRSSIDEFLDTVRNL